MKISPHRQAIAIFSIVIPSILIIGLLIGILHGRGKLQASHAKKEEAFQTYQAAKSSVTELEAFLSLDNRREKVTYWNKKLNQDFIQEISGRLNEILAKYDDSVLKQTEMKKAQKSALMGNNAKHPHSVIELSFQGGFKPMQMLMAELERDMPNLMLESITISPDPASADGETDKLNFKVNYLCWENPKA